MKKIHVFHPLEGATLIEIDAPPANPGAIPLWKRLDTISMTKPVNTVRPIRRNCVSPAASSPCSLHRSIDIMRRT